MANGNCKKVMEKGNGEKAMAKKQWQKGNGNG